MALTLLLVRHGETTYNAEARFQGQRDIPLSDTGREQAERLGERLAAIWATPKPLLPGPPAALYVSDLRRAAETAEIIVSRLAERLETRLVPRPLPLLRERHFGAWEGLTIGEIRARYGYEGDARGAETWPEVWERMMSALETIWREHSQPGGQEPQPETPPPVVLVVGHGGSLRALLCRALGIGHEHVRRFRLDNASLSIADFWGRSLPETEGRVALLNDKSHLER